MFIFKTKDKIKNIWIRKEQRKNIKVKGKIDSKEIKKNK